MIPRRAAFRCEQMGCEGGLRPDAGWRHERFSVLTSEERVLAEALDPNLRQLRYSFGHEICG